jgi:hypothetical protein
MRAKAETMLCSRPNQIRLNEKYPEVVEAICQQETTSFIADGEIVTFDGEITSFAKLQGRMQVAHLSADLIRKVPVWFYVFDLLYLDRYDIRQVSLRYRKQVLRNAFDFQGSLRFTDHSQNQRSASGAYFRSRLVRAPGSDLAFPSKINCPVSLTTHTAVSLCETSSPTYCFMTAPPNRLIARARC